MQIQIDREYEVFSGLGGAITQIALHLTVRVHLQHLTAPFAAQMAFVGRFHADTANPIADLVALINQDVVFVLSDRLGVAQRVGRQHPVGVVAQDVHIHAGARQIEVLLLKTQHLLGLQSIHQRDPITVFARAALSRLIEALGIQLQ